MSRALHRQSVRYPRSQTFYESAGALLGLESYQQTSLVLKMEKRLFSILPSRANASMVRIAVGFESCPWSLCMLILFCFGVVTYFFTILPALHRQSALFGFAGINDFGHLLRNLDKDVMVLINDIAKIVHEEVYRWGK